MNETMLKEESIEIIIQVNGRLRSKIIVPVTEPDDIVKQKSAEDEKVKTWIDGKTVVKTIYVPKKLVNFVVK